MRKSWQISWSTIPYFKVIKRKKVDTNYRCIMVFPIPADARSCVYVGPDNGTIRYGMTGMARPYFTHVPSDGMIVICSIEWYEFYHDIDGLRTMPGFFYIETAHLYFGPSNP
jgi:hypothetical protein